MTLRFVLRTIRKRPLLNLIKVIGLSLALSSSLLILLYLKYEMSFDRFNSKQERIFRFTTTQDDFLGGKHFARLFRPVYVPEMAQTFSGIENYLRLVPVRGGVMRLKDRYINISQGFQCDSSFFRFFNIELLSGDREHILQSPGSMVVSESFARRIFNDENPVGQVLALPEGQYYGLNTDFVIKGIMRDFPGNSHLHPEFVSSPVNQDVFMDWAWTYFLLHPDADPGYIVEGFGDFMASRSGKAETDNHLKAWLQPLADIHLHSHKTREIENNSSMEIIYSFSVAVFVLLLIALINFANLTAGMAGYNDRFLFVSRVFGASRLSHLKFFLTEGMVVAFISVLLSAILTGQALNYVKKHFSLDLWQGNMKFAIPVISACVLLLVFSGILLLMRRLILDNRSSLDIRNGVISGKRKISKSLIVVQNTFSIALIAIVIVISRQTGFAIRNSLGAENPDLICLEQVPMEIQKDFTVFKEELLKYPSVEYVSAMMEPPGGDANDMFSFKMEGYPADGNENEGDRIGIFPCDYSFPGIFRLNFIAGEDFSSSFQDAEGYGEYIINRSAVKRLGYQDPSGIVGKEFALFFDNEWIKIPSGKITGVVEDFHLSGIKRPVEPLVLFKRSDIWLLNLVVSFKPGSTRDGLKDTEEVWMKHFPEYPFQYRFVNRMIDHLYLIEILQARLLFLFTLIAVFICSMGLLGLSLINIQHKTKEIGIRKVNGAETGNILLLLSWDFLKWIFLSAFLAFPISLVLMKKWLEGYAYKTELSGWIFMLSGLFALVIAFSTISVQTWKASGRNPSETLRVE